MENYWQEEGILHSVSPESLIEESIDSEMEMNLNSYYNLNDTQYTKEFAEMLKEWRKDRQEEMQENANNIFKMNETSNDNAPKIFQELINSLGPSEKFGLDNDSSHRIYKLIESDYKGKRNDNASKIFQELINPIAPSEKFGLNNDSFHRIYKLSSYGKGNSDNIKSDYREKKNDNASKIFQELINPIAPSEKFGLDNDGSHHIYKLSSYEKRNSDSIENDYEEIFEISEIHKQTMSNFTDSLIPIWEEQERNQKENEFKILRENLDTITMIEKAVTACKEILYATLLKLYEEQNDRTVMLKQYYSQFLQFINLQFILSDLQKEDQQKQDIFDDYYASGCVLNQHIRQLEEVKTPEELDLFLNRQGEIISKFGRSLLPHPLYRVHTTNIREEDKIKSEKIWQEIEEKEKDIRIRESSFVDEKKRKEIKAEKEKIDSTKLILSCLSELAHNLNTTILLTDEKYADDGLNLIPPLGIHWLSKMLVKITFKDLNEKHFARIAYEESYAESVYKRAREVLYNSKLFVIKEIKDIQIIAFECNSPLTAVIAINHFSLNDCDEYPRLDDNISIVWEYAAKFLKLNPNDLHPVFDFQWNNLPGVQKRGRLNYYPPVGFNGFALKVEGRYDDGNDMWIHDQQNGYAIAYHGVSLFPEKKIPNIISEGFKMLAKLEFGRNSLQEYRNSVDVNPLRPKNRTVGDGIYFAKKVEISEQCYSREVYLPELLGRAFKILLQVRLNPEEIRIPKEKEDYYVVPDDTFRAMIDKRARPYRILLKQISPLAQNLNDFDGDPE